MEKFKVKVTNASEVLEIENILSKIGLVARDYSGFSYPKYIANNIDGEFSDYTMFDSGIDEFKLLTINELKDMVVLMQNDVGDANYTCDREKKYYVAGDDVYMYVVQGEWSLCKNLTLEKAIEVWGLKPIKEEAMKESLNDKIASAEVARQEEKHSHYKKDVSHLKMIDPYRIADLYNLHPCADHIMKKSLCAGSRGHKDMLRDIQDIIDTAERWKQMIEEDSSEI